MSGSVLMSSRRLIALTRPVPDALARCQLTHVPRLPIDLAVARRQHEQYEHALAAAGCTVIRVPAAGDLPDSVFVEDTAIVLEELAVIARPGAASRRDETVGVAATLAPFRPLARLTDPATLDGGDVLRLGRRLYVGVGGRTNGAGLAQLAEFVQPLGYEVRRVAMRGCLHLKSAVTELAPGQVVVNPDWVDPGVFEDHLALAVDPGEPFAANVLAVGEVVLAAAAQPRTNARIESAGLALRCIDGSELAKAEGGLTCGSVIFAA